jgi:hypothetical protein
MDLADFDLTDGGTNDRFRLEFDYIDAGGTDSEDLHFEVVVKGDDGAWAHFSADIPQSQDAPLTYDAFFDAFTFHDGADASLFTAADSLSFYFNHGVAMPAEDNPPLDVDFRLTDVMAIPEPAMTAMLLGGLLVGLMFRRRRGKG